MLQSLRRNYPACNSAYAMPQLQKEIAGRRRNQDALSGLETVPGSVANSVIAADCFCDSLVMPK